MRLRFIQFGMVVVVWVVSTTLLSAKEWGTLKGTFVFDGKAPDQKPIDASKEPHCAAHKMQEEKVVVKDGKLKNALIYLWKEDGVDVAPEYEKTASGEVVLDNKDCRFEPRVVTLRTSQTLVVKNSDPPPVSHNTNLTPTNNAPVNPVIPPGDKITQQYPSVESRPFPVSCNIHPWMNAYVLVRKTPYAAVSNDKGEFEIKNLPVGKELEFQLWQEKLAFLKDSKIKDVKVDSKGRFKIKIKPGMNDLGEIKVSSKLFNK